MVASNTLAGVRQEMEKDETKLKESKRAIQKHEDTIRAKTQELQKLEMDVNRLRDIINRETQEKGRIEQEVRGLEQKRMQHQRELSELQRQLEQAGKPEKN